MTSSLQVKPQLQNNISVAPWHLFSSRISSSVTSICLANIFPVSYSVILTNPSTRQFEREERVYLGKQQSATILFHETRKSLNSMRLRRSRNLPSHLELSKTLEVNESSCEESPSGTRVYEIATLLCRDSPDTTPPSSSFGTRGKSQKNTLFRQDSFSRPLRPDSQRTGGTSCRVTDRNHRRRWWGLSRVPDREDTANKSVNRTKSRARATPGRVQSVFTQQADCDEIRDFWEMDSAVRGILFTFHILRCVVREAIDLARVHKGSRVFIN